MRPPRLNLEPSISRFFYFRNFFACSCLRALFLASSYDSYIGNYAPAATDCRASLCFLFFVLKISLIVTLRPPRLNLAPSISRFFISEISSLAAVPPMRNLYREPETKKLQEKSLDFCCHNSTKKDNC